MNTLKYEAKEKADKDSPCCYPSANTFPEVNLTGNQVTAIFGEGAVKAGDVYETSFQFRVSSITVPVDGDEESKERRVTLKLVAAESVEGAEETDEDPVEKEA